MRRLHTVGLVNSFYVFFQDTLDVFNFSFFHQPMCFAFAFAYRRGFFVSDSKQHDILFSNAYPKFCRDEPALREIFQKARLVRELLPIDFVFVVAALVAEGGGGTCLFKYSVHAFVSFMLNVSCGF